MKNKWIRTSMLVALMLVLVTGTAGAFDSHPGERSSPTGRSSASCAQCPGAPFAVPAEYIHAAYGGTSSWFHPGVDFSGRTTDPNKARPTNNCAENATWDIGVPGEAPVYAAYDGFVDGFQYANDTGVVMGIYIRHENVPVDGQLRTVCTYYTHMANANTGKSTVFSKFHTWYTPVQRGEQIGWIGNKASTGSTFVHLHFGVGFDLYGGHCNRPYTAQWWTDPSPFLGFNVNQDNGASRYCYQATCPDGTPPTTSASLAGASGDNDWYRSNVQVTLTASDDKSGVSRTQYRIDGGPWQTYVGPFTVSGDGHHAVYYQSQDNANNWESEKQVSMSIDATAPTGFLTLNDNATTTPQVLVSVGASATDATSGVSQMRLRDAGSSWSDWQPYATRVLWQLPAVTGQTHRVQTQFKDWAGNESAVYSDDIALNIYPARPTSANHRLAKSTAGMSGTSGQSAHYRLQGTAGQPSMIGQLASVNYKLSSGYWAMQRGTFAVYLALVLRSD